MDLTADDFDAMHHAIGRMSIENAYRNYYRTKVGEKTAHRFEKTGCWDLICEINDGRDAIYSVSMHGIRLLCEWLKQRR